jgi:hypothetical protein
MARRTCRPVPTHHQLLESCSNRCLHCHGPLWVAYTNERTVTTLTGVYRLTLRIRRCINPACPRYHQAYRPEEEGAWALPHGEFGLDVIALIGALRYSEYRSVPEIHQQLLIRNIQLAERTVTYLLQRYEELVTLRLADHARLRACLTAQGQVLLALDGLQPDRGHEVLWVIRDCLSGEVLLARSLLSSTQGDLVALLREVKQALPVPVGGVISDGQETIRTAVQAVFPTIPHQLCQFHYLREAALPIFEADRHAKTTLQKHVRGVRPLERALEGRADVEAAAIRGYCLAVRSAITDDGRPPLSAPGLRLYDRLHAIVASIDRVGQEKGGCLSLSRISNSSCSAGWRRQPHSGPSCAKRMSGFIRRRISWRITSSTIGQGCSVPTRRCSQPSGRRRRRRAGSQRWPATF